VKKIGFVEMAMGGLAAAGVAGVLHQAYCDIRTKTFPYKGFEQHRVTTSTGNIITYYTRPAAPGGPTLVLEAGLMNSSLAWLLVADHLDSDIGLVVYDRAGYRGSLRRAGEDYHLGESVTDLCDVIEDATEDPVFLAGHSLGGYLVHEAAARLGQNARGVILVDPTHPRELQHSLRQRTGSHGINMTLKLGPVTSLLGGGLLVDKDNLFVFAEGSPYVKPLRWEASAANTWRASKREWNYSYPFMLHGGRPLEKISVPVTVLGAATTTERSPEQLDLYDEYIASGTGGEVHTIPGSSHLSIINSVEHAPLTAARIEKHISEWIQPEEEEK
jgi:pimeloyl-ACP methyl ester carboxylesterase